MVETNLRTVYSWEWAHGLIEEISRSRLHPEYFCNVSWLSSWLFSLPSPPSLLTFQYEEKCVGLVILGTQKRRSGLLTWNAAYLNQTGISSCDQSWIEYNDVLCKDGWEDACIEALMNFIEASTFTEFHISLAKKPISWLNAVSEHWYIETDKHFAAKVNLDVSNATGHYSKNTKYQINRAIKSVTSRYGSMNVHRAISIEEKRKYFLLLAEFHIAKWKDSEYGSGFQNPIFTRHLNKLIEQFPEQVDLVSVSAGTTLLGVSFNLIAGDKIGFYCSGINYAIADKKIKPGYLLHHKLIEYYAQEGKTEYDFLAGYSQYKKSMSSDTYSLSSINFTRKNLKGISIHWLRRCKLRLRAYASKLPIPQ